MGNILIAQPAHTFNVLEGIVHTNEQQLNIDGYHPVRTYHPTYDLLDMYIEPKTAGSINGTPAEPGPGGNRLVRDVENKISIVGGVETWVAQATPAFADQDRVYSQLPITRAFGVLAICKYRVSTANPNFPLAFVNSITPGWSSFANVEAGFYNNGAGQQLSIVYNATVGPIVGGIEVDTDYLLAIELRTNGAIWKIRGGIFTNWTTLFVHTLGSTSTLYVASTCTTAVFTLDDVRSPARKFQDVPLASDSFAGVAASMDGRLTDGLGHPEANGGGGLTWTDKLGSWSIGSNSASCTSVTSGSAIATVPTNTPNVICDVALTTASNGGGVVRYTNASNYVSFWYDGTNAHLDKFGTGGASSLINAVGASVANAVIRVIANGTSFRLFYNYALISAAQTISDAGLQNGVNHGIYTNAINTRVDDFSVWPTGNEGQYSDLDLI